MPNAKFNAKSFNPEVFKYQVGHVPNLKTNEIVKSKAFVGNPDIKSAFSSQGGTSYARIAMRGLLEGEAVNYDGNTDIDATTTKTFEQGVVVIGRAKGFVELDFSYDITAGEDFMRDVVAPQVAEYWEAIDQDTVLSIFKGIFSMTGDAKSEEFVSKHTYDITGNTEKEVGATTLNSAVNKACGANKKKFSLVFMHSDVSTHLENLNLLQHLKYTDKDGVQRDLDLGTWNGKLVVIDDSMPTETVVTTQSVSTVKVTAVATAGDKFTVCGTEIEWVSGTATGNQIKLPSSDTAQKEATAIQTFLAAVTTGEIAKFTWTVDGDTVTATQKTSAPDAEFSAEVAAGASTFAATITANATPGETATNYTTYVLGEGSFYRENIGAKEPYEMARDPKTKGGQTTLYTRQRKVFAPFGISYEKASQASLSPTNAELETASNWILVHSGEAQAADRSYINHKSIAIARIISRG